MIANSHIHLQGDYFENQIFYLVTQKYPEHVSLYLIYQDFTCPSAKLTGPDQFWVTEGDWALHLDFLKAVQYITG